MTIAVGIFRSVDGIDDTRVPGIPTPRPDKNALPQSLLFSNRKNTKNLKTMIKKKLKPRLSEKCGSFAERRVELPEMNLMLGLLDAWRTHDDKFGQVSAHKIAFYGPTLLLVLII